MTTDPEEERASSGHPLEVTLYTRPGCHLCEEAKALMQPLLEEFAAKLREINIDSNPQLLRRYGMDIPVVFIGADKAAKHRVNAEQFRRHLEEAQARRRSGEK